MAAIEAAPSRLPFVTCCRVEGAVVCGAPRALHPRGAGSAPGRHRRCHRRRTDVSGLTQLSTGTQDRRQDRPAAAAAAAAGVVARPFHDRCLPFYRGVARTARDS